MKGISLNLDTAAHAAGIALNYINAHGKLQSIPDETKQHLLDAMHCNNAATTECKPVPNVVVYTIGKKMSLTVNGVGDYSWLLTTEKGEQFKGHVKGEESFSLPSDLPLGYHWLTLTQDKNHAHCRIIVAPERCYEPPTLRNGEKLWGACIQLYSLRSEKNWGIGDFSDLKYMLSEIAKRGGSFVGINPIHALFPANPESVSPYSPSSRNWLNVIYIDVNAVEDFKLSKEAQAWWQMPDTQQLLQKARENNWVDYSSVFTLKMTALRMAWKGFAVRNDEQMAAFRKFIAQEGKSLYWQAVFDTLHAWLIKKDDLLWGWPVWPEAYQSPDLPEIKAFCETHRNDIDFYLWLQWLANVQLAACWKTCQAENMCIGLYRDLAVGVAEGGAETWCDRELYCLKASVGAPPDILGPQGQNWGLPPMDPHIITARAYEPFIQLLRANMQHCGALRIDHVMSILRLWWIPYGETADHGAYVHYPVDDLLSILALESQRHHCMVIGEDLGTVPVEIIGKLQASGVYSYKVLFFEHDQNKVFRSPEAYPEQSMAVVTTHDLPTLKGYWGSKDLTLGKKLGLYPDEVMLRELYKEREQEKLGLLNALHKYDCLPGHREYKAPLMSMTPTLNCAIQRYIAGSNSALLGLQPEDWLNMAEPVNVPGTSTQYKNWRRKLSVSLDTMFTDEIINKLINFLDKQRKNINLINSSY